MLLKTAPMRISFQIFEKPITAFFTTIALSFFAPHLMSIASA